MPEGEKTNEKPTLKGSIRNKYIKSNGSRGEVGPGEPRMMRSVPHTAQLSWLMK